MAAPDYHFLYIDPTYNGDWLFNAAHKYWDRFRPIVIYDLELVSYVYPPGRRWIALTSLTRRDLAPALAEKIKTDFPRIIHDPLVYDFVEEMKLTLDGRAYFGQRFGVPEAPDPSATPKR